MHGRGRAQGGKGTFIENRRDRKKAAVNLKRRHLPVSGRLGGRTAFYKLYLCHGSTFRDYVIGKIFFSPRMDSRFRYGLFDNRCIIDFVEVFVLSEQDLLVIFNNNNDDSLLVG